MHVYMAAVAAAMGNHDNHSVHVMLWLRSHESRYITYVKSQAPLKKSRYLLPHPSCPERPTNGFHGFQISDYVGLDVFESTLATFSSFYVDSCRLHYSRIYFVNSFSRNIFRGAAGGLLGCGFHVYRDEVTAFFKYAHFHFYSGVSAYWQPPPFFPYTDDSILESRIRLQY